MTFADGKGYVVIMEKLQVLVATMHQKEYSLAQKMNIKTDAIIVNQCDRNAVEEFEENGVTIKWLSLAERGVGLSRNTSLTRATGDILLFADDDVVYYDDYEETVLTEFEKHPEADIITFNFVSLNEDRPTSLTTKGHRLHWYNCLKFGTFRVAVRRDALFKKNIFFSLLFGGGAKYQSGEDSCFITQCLRSGMKGYASPKYLGEVLHTESTWFKGYTEKYYYDKGALYRAVFGKRMLVIALLMELKHFGKKSEFTFTKKLQLYLSGMKDFDHRGL